MRTANNTNYLGFESRILKDQDNRDKGESEKITY